MAHVVFTLEGMRCSGCSRTVTRAIRALPGVGRISVNVATARAAVDWDPQRVTLPQILAAITASGFKPVPLAGTAAAAEQRNERRAALKRIGLAGLGMMQTMMFVYCIYAAGSHGIDPGIAQYLKLAGLLIATPVLVYSGAPFFKGALRDLRRRSPGMDVPVALALALAYGASVINTLRGVGEIYFDSVTMFIFFLLAGRFVEMSVRQRNLSATEAFARSLPATVTRIAPDGSAQRISPQLIEPGDLLSIPKGAVIPVNAVLAVSDALVDESLLTGESVAVHKSHGQPVSGGSLNAGHPIQVTASGRVSESMLASIVALLERAQAERSSMTLAADRVASWFVLATLTLATGAALFWLFVEPGRALPAVLAVLVVTCPCALSLATPAAIAAATARLARLGLLVTRPDALERLSRVSVVVVDKTGTLTRGQAKAEIVSVNGGHSADEALAIAAALESQSEHPIAAAFRSYVRPDMTVESARELAGGGVEGVIGGVLWRLGNREFVGALEDPPSAKGDERSSGSLSEVVLGNSNGVVATFAVCDSLRSDAVRAVQQLRDMGLEVTIASGDQEEVVRSAARQLGIQRAIGRLTPQQKLGLVQFYKALGSNVLMVGDGVNDGPVLAAASVSCAMAEGSAVAQAAADLLLLNDSLVCLAEAIRMARRLRSVIYQNLGWAFAYNVAAVPLAAIGWIPPWVAAVGMSISSLLVVLNAARLARGGTTDESSKAARDLGPVTAVGVPT